MEYLYLKKDWNIFMSENFPAKYAIPGVPNEGNYKYYFYWCMAFHDMHIETSIPPDAKERLMERLWNIDKAIFK